MHFFPTPGTMEAKIHNGSFFEAARICKPEVQVRTTKHLSAMLYAMSQQIFTLWDTLPMNMIIII